MAYLAFSGSFEHSLDGKGRVIIPASFREALGENFTITINPTRTAVAIYPKEMWDGQLERLSHINPMDKIGLQYERYLMSVSFPETAWTRRDACSFRPSCAPRSA